MKKLLLPVIFLIFLPSCNSLNVNKPQFPLSVGGKVEATYGFYSYTADISVQDDGTLKLTVTQPRLLKDVVMVLNSDGTQVLKDSIQLEYADGKLEKICPLAQIYDILYALNTQEPTLTPLGEKCVAEFDYEGKKCSVTAYTDSGLIEKIKTPDSVFTFKN